MKTTPLRILETKLIEDFEEDEPTEWALVRGELTGIYKVWSKRMWEVAASYKRTEGVNTLVTFGDNKEVLTLLAQLHNEQLVRDEGGIG